MELVVYARLSGLWDAYLHQHDLVGVELVGACGPGCGGMPWGRFSPPTQGPL